MSDREEAQKRTIEDFGAQWQANQENLGFYASQELFADTVGPLKAPEDFRGLRVADIGSGTGRIVSWLLGAGAAEVLAVEPSEAFPVLEKNLAWAGERVRCLRCRGDELPPGQDLDMVVSIGVIHHIPDPLPTLRAAREALRPGGELLIWVYGYEGNEAYLALVLPLRRLTTRLPDSLLWGLSCLAEGILQVYTWLARVLPLPLRDYLVNVLAPMRREERRLVVFDQLNPEWARYYRGPEIQALVEEAGFEGVRIHHRRGYSWSVLARRPEHPLPPDRPLQEVP